MATRSSRALSEISSAVSESAPNSPRSPTTRDGGARAATPGSAARALDSHGYAHLRGITSPTNTSFRSPTPQSGGASASRPQSPDNPTSRTHIPSLTAQGFLRPLSSTRLQQQRLQNLRTSRAAERLPPSLPHDTLHHLDDLQSLRSSHTGPYSALPRGTRSVSSGYAGSEGLTEHETLPPRSLSTADRNMSPQRKQPPPPLNTQSSFSGSGSQYEKPIRTPRSFRSGLSIGNKQIFEPGHQHLPSHDNSPMHLQPDEKLETAKQAAGGKNYEYFEGNNVFYMKGRLQNARDRPINLMTATLVLLPTVLFFVFSAPYLWHNVSPAIPMVYAYLFFVCFSSFLHGSLTDPGILPRNIHAFPPPVNDDPLAVPPTTNDWVMVRLATSETSAMDVPVKYCRTCNIWRPPRCYHCRVCDNCVETLDHHCVWLNNCVGRRNYRFFFSFVSSGIFLSLLLILGCLGQVLDYSSKQRISFRSAINAQRVPFALFIFGILLSIYPIALTIYHLVLTGAGETTREYLTNRRFDKSDRHRTFNQGNVFKNWIAVFGRPRPPTYMHFKRQYEEGDQRYGTVRGYQERRTARQAQADLEMQNIEKGFYGPTGPIEPRKLEAR